MGYETIIYEKKGNISYVKFNRPEFHNALNEQMIRELNNVLNDIEADNESGALILTGSGKSFLSGADINMINEWLRAPYECFLAHDKLTRFNFRLERLRIPVIAAINGFALGGGLEIAIACDFRIVSEKAKLGLPEVGLGIMPGSGATARLARLIGKEMALHLELTGDSIDAQEAYRIGLISSVVPDGEVLKVAEELATRILRNAPAAIALIKRAIQVGADMPVEGAMEYCQYASMVLTTTKDAKEGMKAFLEKRKPVWQGK